MLPAKLLQAAAGNGGYFIERSLRFNPTDSAHLSWTPASAGNQRKWTWSGWVKKCTQPADSNFQMIFYGNSGASGSGANHTGFGFMNNSGASGFYFTWKGFGLYTGSSGARVFRDPAAWYHLVVSVDIDNGTAANRVRVYVNNEEITTWALDQRSSMSGDGWVNGTVGHYVGQQGNSAQYYDGYITEVHLVDGQNLTPSSFGASEGGTGAWRPKKYAGTYGTNGFYLPFSDNGSLARLGINKATTNPFSVATSNDKLLLCAAGLSSSYFVDFADERSITNVSSVSYSTSKKKFGNTSLYFNGSHYLTVPFSNDFNFEDQDFTIEFWVNPDSIAGAGLGRQFMAINSTGAPTTDGWFIDIDNTNAGGGAPNHGQFLFRYRFGGTYSTVSTTGVPAGSWTHIAFVRSGTSIYAFKNGTLANTDSSVNGSLNFTTTNDLRIGDGYEAAVNITAYIGAADQIRITKGVARYTSNFTAPVASFVADLWTAAGLSVTAGAGNDSTLDVPTMSPTASNWCTLSSVASSTSNALNNGNLQCGSFYASDIAGNVGTMFVDSGKWYWEVTVAGASTYPYLGITADPTGRLGDTRMWYGAWMFRPSGATVNSSTYLNSTENTTGVTSFTNGDVIMFALDCDNKKLWVGKNGTWFNSGNPASGTNQQVSWTLGYQVSPLIMGYQSQGTGTVFNFGQRVFAYTAPTGFKTLNTFNLPAPSIKKGSQYFRAITWSGDNSSTRSITGVGFQPDFTWVKNRTTALSNLLYDAVRGAGTLKALVSDATVAEGSGSDNATNGYLHSFDADGFSVTKGSTTNGYTNSSSNNYIAWNWKRGATPGFDIVTGTTTQNNFGSVTSHAHTLGAVPKFFVVKPRGIAGNWIAYHESLPLTHRLILSSTAAQANAGTGNNIWAVSTNTFSFDEYNLIGVAGTTFVAYLWSEVPGFSKFGTYKGTGLADGAFVYTGFKPRWILWKRSSSTGSWRIIDTARQTYNGINRSLFTESASAEETSSIMVDTLSNGFKLRNAGAGDNGAGDIHIYAAFAEMPFKYANAF